MTFLVVPMAKESRHNPVMDRDNASIHDIRRKNAQLLCSEFKTLALFARHIGRDEGLVSRWIGVGVKNPKPIGANVARHVEQACDRPSGWLDRVHPDTFDQAIDEIADQLDALLDKAVEKMPDNRKKTLKAAADIIRETLLESKD